MTVFTHPGANAKGGTTWQRMLTLVLCAVVLLGLFLTFSSGVHSKVDTPVSFSGLDFLLGRPDGKSNGSPHPMLLLSMVSTLSALVMMLFFRDKRSMLGILVALAGIGLLMFRFDVTYSAKNEFNIAADTVSFGFGWLISCACAFAALILIIWDNSIYAYEKRRAFVASIYANTTLPKGYRVRTTREIIAMDFRRHWPVYLLILPTVIFYIIWCYGPLYGIIIAFNDFAPKKGILGSNWVGLRWFRDFFRGPFAFRTIRNTLLINIYNLLIGFPAPIILALMLNEMRSIRYKRVVQTVTYMPYFISLVVLCGILKDFSSTDGLFGTLMQNAGMTPVNLLGDAQYFRSMYIGSELWQKLGWDSIIFLSALAGIDQELYEAATIDGASRWKQILHVTLPGIMPTISILLILRVGSMMSVGYEKIILLYNGLTYETGDVISSYVYRKGIIEADFSFSTAVNLFNSIINFALVVFANRVSAALTETSLW